MIEDIVDLTRGVLEVFEELTMHFEFRSLFAAAVLTAALAAPQTSDTPGATPGGDGLWSRKDGPPEPARLP